MRPEWRRLLPLPVAFVVGVLGSLLLGAGPRSIAAGAGDQEPWALPASRAPDLAQADAIWAERHPWGRPPVTAEEAAAQAVPVAVPVGVVNDRDGLRALFSLDGGLPVAVGDGDMTPDGGTVTSISPTVVTWRDAAGQPKRLELFQDERAATAATVEPGVPASQTPARSRDSAERQRIRQGRQRPSSSGRN